VKRKGINVLICRNEEINNSLKTTNTAAIYRIDIGFIIRQHFLGESDIMPLALGKS
jgi:hypothetical protein